MSDETVFTQHNALLKRLEPELRKEGDEVSLGSGRGIILAHYQITDTELAACLAVLGVPFRDPAPFTKNVVLDAGGNETRRKQTIWWMGAVSHPQGPEAHKTEEIAGAWQARQRFEGEHPLHPLVAMRSGFDARSYWLTVIHQWRSGNAILPIEYRGEAYWTSHLHAVAVLKAVGFQALAFNGRSFAVAPEKGGVHARAVLEEAARPGSESPVAWIACALLQYSHLVEVAKKDSLIISQDFGGGQTLHLSEDAKTKVVDQFHGLIS